MADVDRLAAALLTLLQASDATVSSYLHIQPTVCIFVIHEPYCLVLSVAYSVTFRPHRTTNYVRIMRPSEVCLSVRLSRS